MDLLGYVSAAFCLPWAWFAIKFFIPCSQLFKEVDSVIHRINLYPLDYAIGSPNTYPLDSNLSGGYRYPAFEQLGPGQLDTHCSIVT